MPPSVNSVRSKASRRPTALDLRLASKSRENQSSRSTPSIGRDGGDPPRHQRRSEWAMYKSALRRSQHGAAQRRRNQLPSLSTRANP